MDGYLLRFDKMKRILVAGLALNLALFAAGSGDAAIWCGGKVTTAYFDNSGSLTADWGHQPILLCNLNADTTMAPPQVFIGYKTCQAMYSTLLSAQATGQQFQVLLANDSSCAGLFNAGSVATKYIAAYRIGN